METKTFHLRDPVQAYKLMTEHVWPLVKAATVDGHRLTMLVSPETRSGQQNRLLHAILSDVAEQVEWAGQKRSVDVWKRLMTGAWCRANGEAIELLPAIDGAGVEIVFRRTSKMTKAEVCDLVEYIYAWGVDNGVCFSDGSIDPKTGELLSLRKPE